MKRVGSQSREILAESGMEMFSRLPNREVILRDTYNGVRSKWRRNDDFAGYVVEIDGVGYEYVTDMVSPKEH